MEEMSNKNQELLHQELKDCLLAMTQVYLLSRHDYGVYPATNISDDMEEMMQGIRGWILMTDTSIK